MNFEFFESLSDNDSKAFLDNFLNVEKKAINELVSDMLTAGIKADFSISTLPQVLDFLFSKMKTVPKQIDESLPSWIRECDSYIKNLFVFDEPSKILILRAAYYFGECFIKVSNSLTWGVGKHNTALQNMLVVTGFLYKMELPPILVVENTFGSVVSGMSTSNEFKNVIEVWLSKVPKNK